MALGDRNEKTRPKIRLLELEPGAHVDDQIVGRLIMAPLDPDSEYIALSALHGDPNTTESVTIGHSKQEIPLNLAQAIRHVRAAFPPACKSPDWLDMQTGLSRSSSTSTVRSTLSATPHHPPRSPRLPTGPAWMKHALEGVRSTIPGKDLNSLFHHKKAPHKLRLWVDYLCLSHVDPDEQGVRRMELTRVYKQAKYVVGWTGMKKEDGSTDVAVDAMECISKAIPENWGTQDDKQKHPENYSPYHEWMHELAHFWQPEVPLVPPKPHGGPHDPINKEVPQAMVSGSWISVAQFLVCRYLTRAWILDEIATAKYPVFLAGDRILRWESLLHITRLTEELRDTESNVFPAHLKAFTHQFPLCIVWTLLECERRQNEDREKVCCESAISAHASVTSSVPSVPVPDHQTQTIRRSDEISGLFGLIKI